MHSLTVTQLALSIKSVEGICLHGYNLGLEEVANLDSELVHTLHIV